MTFIRTLLVLAAACTLPGAGAWADVARDHDAHHPKAAAAGSSAPKSSTRKTPPAKAAAQETMTRMDGQMKAMQEMHAKMMKAATPEERQALMAEHMKAMQGGMAMMGEMGMMGGMGKDAAPGAMTMPGDMPLDMGTRQQLMEKRMDMMETMMRMMLDRLPAPSAN